MALAQFGDLAVLLPMAATTGLDYCQRWAQMR